MLEENIVSFIKLQLEIKAEDIQFEIYWELRNDNDEGREHTNRNQYVVKAIGYEQ